MERELALGRGSVRGLAGLGGGLMGAGFEDGTAVAVAEGGGLVELSGPDAGDPITALASSDRELWTGARDGVLRAYDLQRIRSAIP